MNYQSWFHQSNRAILVTGLLVSSCLLNFAPKALCDQQDKEPAVQVSTQTPKVFTGEIEIDTAVTEILPSTPVAQIDQLVSHAIEKQDLQFISTHPLVDKVCDLAQFCTTYKGFESSSEAADVILSEKLKGKSKAAQEYIKQKKYDSLHVQVTTCVLQIAMGLGSEDLAERTQLIDSGVQKLKQLVGEEEALKTQDQLVAWANQIKAAPQVGSKQTWDVLAIENKSREVLKSAIQSDKIVEEVIDRLHKYNRHSNLSRISSKVINTTLSLAALTPTFVSPAAQVAEVIYIGLTGGPEESKLLKEVYLDRRLEERFARLTQEVNLAVTNYNLAKVTKNPVLMSCSESIMNGMSGNQVVTADTADTSHNGDKLSSRSVLLTQQSTDTDASVSLNPDAPINKL